MAKQRVTKSLVAAAIMGFLAVHAATAQQTPSLPVPVGSTAHFVYFDTGAYALTPEDQDHIRDVAGMMQSTPAFVATIIGKTDSVGSAELMNTYPNDAPKRYSRLSFTPTRYRRTGFVCTGPASAYRTYPLPMNRPRRRTGWLRSS
jgi:hypothetical protein